MLRSFAAVLLAAALASAMTGRAGMAQTVMPQGALCTRAIQQAEAGSGLPPRMLGAIATVESGRRDPVTQEVLPWPWTINAQGKGNFFASKAEAIAFARGLQQQGIQSFDVGCMQINMMHHPDAFTSLDEAFDPGANARYAVRFLQALRDKTGSWDTASAWYHSANPAEGGPYRQLVVAAMARITDGPSAMSVAAAYVPVALRPAAFPVSMRFLQGAPPRIIMLPGGGGVRPGGMGATATSAGASASATAMPAVFARNGMIGRGLDSYRAAPVALARFRIAASQ